MFQRHTSKIATLAMLSLTLLFASACSKKSDVPDQPVAEEPVQESKTVVLYQYRFNPTTLDISAGTNVVFQNRDRDPHNINIPALNVDQNIEPNHEWSYTFDTRGEFAVGSRFIDTMKLSVNVQ